MSRHHVIGEHGVILRTRAIPTVVESNFFCEWLSIRERNFQTFQMPDQSEADLLL